MGITDELRKFASCCAGGMDGDLLRNIADRIDAEHRATLVSLGQTQAERDEYLESLHIWEDKLSSMVKLPRDADGEPIHIGDMMDTEHFGIVEVEGFIHNAIAFTVFDPQPARIRTVPARKCRHYKQTVEDVLRDYWRTMDDALTSEQMASITAEYAAKLRLAGEDA